MGSATLTMSRREGFLRRVLLIGADFLEDVNKGLEAYLQSARENASQRTTSTAPSTVRATTEEVTERLASLFHNATTTTVPTTTEEVTERLASLSQIASDDTASQIPVPVSARTLVWSVDENEFVRRTTETPPPAMSWDESEVVIFMLVISFLLIVVAGLAIQCYVIRMIEKRKKLRGQTVTSSAGDAAPHVTLRVNLPSVPVAVETPSPPSYEEPPAYHTLSIADRMEDHCAEPDKKPRVKLEY